jgi:hypothetical protein
MDNVMSFCVAKMIDWFFLRVKKGGSVFRKSISLIVLLSFMCLLWASCSSDGMLTEPGEKRSASDVTAGEVHNEFVRAYLKRCPERELLTRDERVREYVETAKAVCEEQNYDYAPTQVQMDEFLAVAGQWREAGIWDIFNPAGISPDVALDRFVAAGIIPAEHASYLHGLLDELQDQSIEPEGPLTCAAAPCAEMEVAREFLMSSCELWYEWDGTGQIPPEIIENPALAKWWEKALKYLAAGACDGLAGWAAFYATAGNPFAVGFFGGIASIAACDAFNERGW